MVYHQKNSQRTGNVQAKVGQNKYLLQSGEENASLGPGGGPSFGVSGPFEQAHGRRQDCSPVQVATSGKL